MIGILEALEEALIEPRGSFAEELRTAAAYVGPRSPSTRKFLLDLADEIGDDRPSNPRDLDYGALVPEHPPWYIASDEIPKRLKIEKKFLDIHNLSQ